MATADTRPTSLRFPKAELPPGERKLVHVGRREIAVFNVDGVYYAIFNRCPHHQAPLHLGPIGGTSLPASQPGEREYGMHGRVLRCPWHHYEYDLATGRCLAEPDQFRVRTYNVREDGDELVVELAVRLMGSRADARVVDVDFRTSPVTTQVLASRLGEAWRDLLRLDSAPRGKLTTSWSLPSTIYRQPTPGAPVGAYRDAVYTVAGTDVADQAERHAEEQAAATALLDRHAVAYAVLNAGTAPEISAIASPYLAAEIVRATNDWLLEEWLPADPRYLASIVVAATDPRSAAAEIERVGADERVVQVAFAYPPALLGNRALHPIFAAAHELDLTVSLEVGGAFAGGNRGVTGTGVPGSLFELEVGWNSVAQPHVLSLIAEGVFERFPRLRVLLNGFGAAWLPSLLWRMDAEVEAGRVPRPKSLTRRPSEVVHDHVRFTTNGLELPAEPEHLETLLSLVGGERLLVFGSGPGRRELEGPEPLPGLAAGLRELVLTENARALYKLDLARA